MLEHLLRRAGRALTRDEIMRVVWGTDVLVTSRSVDRCVTTLRSKIEPDPRHPRFILTIRDIGYRFELPEPAAEIRMSWSPRRRTARGQLPEGSRLGRYEIGKLIGSGGMGQIFQARDRHLERDVAIKVLSRNWARHPEALARFKREARAVASLSHPSILAIFDVGTDRGLTYLVTELLHGETLRDRIRRAPLDLPLAIEIGVAIAGALSTAHAKGIVHRDVKPSNVFLTEDGGIRVLDFGLAQLPRPSEERMPRPRRSPCPRRRERCSGPSATWHPNRCGARDRRPQRRVLVGVRAVRDGPGPRAVRSARRPADTTAAILNDVPSLRERRDTRVPDGLIHVVTRCLEKNPEDRFPDARGVLTALVTVSTTIRRGAG